MNWSWNENIFQIGAKGTVHILGIKLVGLNAENGGKLLISFLFIVISILMARLIRTSASKILKNQNNIRVEFWTRQGISLGLTLLILIGICSIWFDDPTRLTTAFGLITAGLAFALQKAITSIAGYIVILRGKTFNVGDRIVMGGVRGDVVALGFMQTSIMEMGQPPSVQQDDPGMWVKSRQLTGRLVTVPNSKIFDEPVYNYTRDFEFIWEEMLIPISYSDDRAAAERILLEVAQKHQVAIDDLKRKEIEELQRLFYVVKLDDFQPRVFLRLTDNWLELTVRFITYAHGIREVKDRMTREIIARLESAKIPIASATIAVVELPEVRLRPRQRQKT